MNTLISNIIAGNYESIPEEFRPNHGPDEEISPGNTGVGSNKAWTYVYFRMIVPEK